MSHPLKPQPVVISARLVSALTEWTMDSPGHHLNMVAFRKDTYTATDGHRLVIGPCDTRGQSFGVHTRYLRAAVAAFDSLMPVDPSPRFTTLSITPEPHHGMIRIDCDPSVESVTGVSVHLMAPYRDLDSAGFPSVAAFDQQFTTDQPGTGLRNYALNPEFLAAIGRVHAATKDGGDENGVIATGWSGATKDVDGKMRNLGAVAFKNAAGVRFVVMPIRWKLRE